MSGDREFRAALEAVTQAIDDMTRGMTMDFDTMTLLQHEAAFTGNEDAIKEPLEGFRDARGTHAFPPDALAVSDQQIADYERRQRLIVASRAALASYRASLADLNADGFPALPLKPTKPTTIAAFDETIATLQAARAQLEEAEPDVTGGTLTFAKDDEG